MKRPAVEDRHPLDVFQKTPLDVGSIRQGNLDIREKERSNLFPWTGQFSPQLVEALLRTYAKPDEAILDPFLGSGTVLCEAGRLGLPGFGAEIHPAAFKMAQTYRFINASPEERKSVLHRLETKMNEALPDSSPLFSDRRFDRPVQPPARALLELSSCLTDQAEKTLLDALMIFIDFQSEDLTAKRIFDGWRRLRSIVTALPFSQAPIVLDHADARALRYRAGGVGLALTSPPYINVFNYHQQYRLSVEALGWDVLKVARSEIGANRKHRGNRFLTVVQYCLDMTDALLELKRVCKAEARIILVLGRESNVRKTRFLNGEIVAALGVRCAGLRLETRQERAFKNRFGALIREDILHFSNATEGAQTTLGPVEIAQTILRDAASRAPEESQADLEAALALASEVQRSPIYRNDGPMASSFFFEGP